MEISEIIWRNFFFWSLPVTAIVCAAVMLIKRWWGIGMTIVYAVYVALLLIPAYYIFLA